MSKKALLICNLHLVSVGKKVTILEVVDESDDRILQFKVYNTVQILTNIKL